MHCQYAWNTQLFETYQWKFCGPFGASVLQKPFARVRKWQLDTAELENAISAAEFLNVLEPLSVCFPLDPEHKVRNLFYNEFLACVNSTL